MQVSVTLPPTFSYVPGTSTLSASEEPDPTVPDPTVDGTSLGWTLANLPVGTSVLSFQANAGIGLGAATASLSASIGGVVNSSSPATVSVVDGEAPEIDSASSGFPLSPGTPPTGDGNLNIGYITSPGNLNDWSVTVPQNDELSLALTNLPAAYDLELFGPAGTQLQGTPSQDLPGVSDTLPSVTPNSTTEATPGSQDLAVIPPPGDQLEAVSNNPGGQSQYIQTPPLPAGTYTVQVSGYNGAYSTSPYLLQANLIGGETAPSCPGGIGYVSSLSTIAPASGPVTIPTGVNTLFLVDTQRLTASYGASAEATIMTDLDNVASDSSAGVVGAVIPVDSYAQVQNAYATWNANPCSVTGANGVVSAISAVVDQIRAAYSTVQNLVLVGPDDQIPFARVADGASQSNERDYGAATFAGENNVEADALSEGYYLSDDPFSASQPLGVGSATLYVPELATGRLVESAAQIEGALTRFTGSSGDLDATTSLTTGYSFLTSGANAVSANLAANGLSANGATASQLIGESWTQSDLDSALVPSQPSTTPAIDSINAHFDYSRALPAADNTCDNAGGDTSKCNTDLFTTSDVRGSLSDYAGRLLFSMGCHAGLDIDDAEVAASGIATPVDDWAKTFADAGALWIANTGFGYADTDTLAYSAKLMSEFAGELNGSLTIGEALTAAKQQYAAGNAILSPYDMKALMESTFYGLPMYNLNASGTPVAPPSGGSTETDPTFPTTGLTVARFSVSPALSLATGGGYYEATGPGGGTQATEYRPIEPLVTLPATEAGLIPHGALITALGSSDVANFSPAYSMPAVASENSAPPLIGDAAFPGTLQRVASFATFTSDGTGQGADVDLVAGQYFPNPSSPGKGTQRLFDSIAGQTYYLPPTSPLANDFTPPVIDSSQASTSGGLSFTVKTTATGAPVEGVLVLYTDGVNPGTWTALDLTSSDGGQTWTGAGTTPPSGQVQYLLEAVDAAGNVAVSNNEGADFNGAPAVPITITLSGAGPTNGYYTSTTVTANITAPAGSTYVLDGAPAEAVSGPVTISGNGQHTITVTSPAEVTASQSFAISSSETTTSLQVSADPSVVGQQVTFTATVAAVTPGSGTPAGSVTFYDDGSAIPASATCTGALSGGSASCTVEYPSASTAAHAITAIYPGGGGFTGSSTAAALEETVDPAGTTLALSSSPSPSVVGQQVTYTATVSVSAPGAGSPTGPVEFLDGANAIGGACGGTSGTPLNGTSATCTVAYNASGSHSISAVYPGDINFAGSSAVLSPNQSVNKDGTTTSLSSSANPSVVGQPVTYTATVAASAPGSGTPTGSVTFYDANSVICSATGVTPSAGTAVCMVPENTAATHSITAAYSGDANYAASSTATALSQTVNRASTTTSLSANGSSAIYGSEQAVVFTATVSPLAPGAGAPTGTITVEVGSTVLCTIKPPGSTCSTTAKALAASVTPYSITAVYGGDGNFTGSTSTAVQLTVVTQACVTGTFNGPIVIGAGKVGCIAAGATVNGPVTVSAGGALVTSGATINGALSSAGALGVALCGTKITGAVTVTGSILPVLLGGGSCAGDTFSAAVSLSGNHLGVLFDNDTVTGSLNISNNFFGVTIAGNTETGNATVSSNTGGVSFTKNTLHGNLVITNNSGGFTFSGNTISGTVTNTGNH